MTASEIENDHFDLDHFDRYLCVCHLQITLFTHKSASEPFIHRTWRRIFYVRNFAS